MARESAGQCGPCVYGLGAIAEATRRIAHGTALDADLDGLDRWSARSRDGVPATIPTAPSSC